MASVLENERDISNGFAVFLSQRDGFFPFISEEGFEKRKFLLLIIPVETVSIIIVHVNAFKLNL